MVQLKVVLISSTRYTNVVSIPNGSIKSSQKIYQQLLFGVVSIPNGSIKSLLNIECQQAKQCFNS